MSGKILTAYFSMRGETLEGMEIVVREKGHAQLAAEFIHEAAGGDLFEIETTIPYPEDHMQRVMRARREIEQNDRPELKRLPDDFERYDIVFLCFPIWWFTIPMPVATFLGSLDWNGKTIIPVNTSNSSGTGRSTQDIRLLSGNTFVDSGLELRGQSVKHHKAEIQEWAIRKRKALILR